MARLYLMRHGQTEYNLRGLVQGRCDSPLTPAGIEQARTAGAWLAGERASLARICSSPLSRALETARIVRGELMRAHAADPAHVPFPPQVEETSGIIERSFGSFEGGPKELVPTDLWDPGEEVEPFGGEGSRTLRVRMVTALTELMEGADAGDVLAVSHGSASLQFKLAWEGLARCPQDVPIGNCCIMVFGFDPAARTFACERIVNQG